MLFNSRVFYRHREREMQSSTDLRICILLDYVSVEFLYIDTLQSLQNIQNINWHNLRNAGGPDRENSCESPPHEFALRAWWFWSNNMSHEK
jgi:hypothetical protein